MIGKFDSGVPLRQVDQIRLNQQDLESPLRGKVYAQVRRPPNRVSVADIPPLCQRSCVSSLISDSLSGALRPRRQRHLKDEWKEEILNGN